MKCPDCGYQELDDSAICSRCGKVLKASGAGVEVAEEILDEEEAKAKRQARIRRIAIPAGGVVVAAALVIVLTRFVHGAPANVQGMWSDSAYGGPLALLSNGLQVQIQSESSGGRLSGSMGYGASTTPIDKSAVRGHHIYIEAKSSFVTYILNGTVSTGGSTITAIVTKELSGETPQKSATTLHKASA